MNVTSFGLFVVPKQDIATMLYPQPMLEMRIQKERHSTKYAVGMDNCFTCARTVAVARDLAVDVADQSTPNKPSANTTNKNHLETEWG